jgi:hypothetical protein
MRRALDQGTTPLTEMASSGHTSSHLRQPKQASSLITSSEPSLNFRQRTGHISTQAPQALQWSRISMVGFIIYSHDGLVRQGPLNWQFFLNLNLNLNPAFSLTSA